MHENHSSTLTIHFRFIAVKLSNQVTIILAGPFSEQSDNRRMIPSRRNCARWRNRHREAWSHRRHSNFNGVDSDDAATSINGPAYELSLTIDSYEYIVSAFGGYLDFRFFVSNLCVNHFKSTLGNAVNLEPPAPAYTVYSTRYFDRSERQSKYHLKDRLWCIK